jgi:putative transposase
MEYLLKHNTKILKDSLSNLATAFTRFFKKKSKYPNFKKKQNDQSIGLYNEAFSKKVFDKNNFMFISSKFGEIKYKTSKEYKELLKTNVPVRITINKNTAGQYFAKVLIECGDVKQLSITDKTVGIDLGIKEFVTTSDGEVFENLKLDKKYKNRMSRMKRQLSKKNIVETGETFIDNKTGKEKKKKQSSNNREKLKKKIAKLQKKITNKKNNHIHNVVNTLINENQVIGMEDLNVAGMMKNHKLAYALQDVSLGKFREVLTYKCAWYGRNLIFVDRFFPSSKLCSACGEKNNDLKLKDRTWICAYCHTSHDRDVNAATNIDVEAVRIYSQ